MALNPPAAADEPPRQDLVAALARAGADWTRIQPGRPPQPPLCPEAAGPLRPTKAGKAKAKQPVPEVADRWLRMEFAPMVLAFAQRFRLDEAARHELRDALHAARFAITPLPATVRAMTTGGVLVKKIERTDACPIITAHLEPLLNPQDFIKWLERLARDNFFFRAAASRGAVPISVHYREAARDRDLVDRWAGAPPARPQLAPSAKEAVKAAAEREYLRRLDKYNRQSREAGAFVASDPNAFPLSVPTDVSPKEARLLEALNQAGHAGLMPVINLGGGPAPTNLYISEAAPFIAEYLAPLRPVLVATAGGLGLNNGLLAVAYGLLALVTIPVNCLYDAYHGTCAIETLVPRLLACTDAMSGFARRGLQRIVAELLRPRADEVEEREAVILLNAFAGLADALGAGFRGALLRLLAVAADQGARVRTPVQFTKAGEWEFTISEPQENGSDRPVTRKAPEILSYVGTDRDTHREVFWILPGLWSALGTGVALANQSGVRVWINAANNRWGGNHPPHRVHRQGCSLDLDAGLAWRTDKVQNVVKRDYVGLPLPDSEVKDNHKNTDCLHLTERIAGWIITQSFVLVGVTQYLYGDAALVEQACAHLQAHFDVSKPARMDGIMDAAGHNDHWHFELLIGPRSSGAGQFIWQVPDGALLDKLRELAVKRDDDDEFWLRFAGLEKVPNQLSDFDELEDAEDWKRWWNRRNEAAGIPILPVWAPQEAQRTNIARECWEPAGDFPDAFKPGEAST